jgi:predicted GNAT superfamily acetyltransferase
MIHHVYVFTYLTSFVHVNLGGKEIVNEWMQNLKMKLLQNEITSQQTGTDISSAAANSDEVQTVQMPRIIGRAKRKKIIEQENQIRA